MQNNIAIITGVSRLKGIGRAICCELAKKGFDIFFTYWLPYDKTQYLGVQDDEPKSIQEEIRGLGVRCEKLELDLSESKATSTLLQAVEEKLGSPSVLVNNATYSINTSIDTLTESELDKHYTLNIKANVFLTQEFIKRFKHNNGGRIVNLTSGQSLGAMPDEIAYAMTKAAIENFTKMIYHEIAHKGITINCVNPGPNDTGWMDEPLKKELVKSFPMGRIGQPTDAAKLIGFLCSKEAEWITGQVIHSEGGLKR